MVKRKIKLLTKKILLIASNHIFLQPEIFELLNIDTGGNFIGYEYFNY
jgi:hypothetical protein